MTIVESLKKFLTKLGGDPTKLENNATSADIIDAISEAYTDKEGTYTEVTPIGSEGTKIATITTNNTGHDIYAPKELPAATSEDEGMVLSVNNEGAWAKANPPTELPAVTYNDKNKTLMVDNNGNWKVDSSITTGYTIYITEGALSTIKDNVTTENVTIENMLKALGSVSAGYFRNTPITFRIDYSICCGSFVWTSDTYGKPSIAIAYGVDNVVTPTKVVMKCIRITKPDKNSPYTVAIDTFDIGTLT